MALKCYFDGGNQAQLTRYKTITLCVIAGTEIQWKNFDKRWSDFLSESDAPYIHTTDMVAGNDPFSRRNGWSQGRVHQVLSGGTSIIRQCMANPKRGWKHGIMPMSVTLLLEDFKRAVNDFPRLGPPELHAMNHCVKMCGHWANEVEVHKLQFIFDRNEPFFGHVQDRLRNPRSRKEETAWQHIIGVTEADSKQFPGLQASDMIAWSTGKGHEGDIRYEWQREIIDVHRASVLLDYDRFSKRNENFFDAMERWKIPRRKPFK